MDSDFDKDEALELANDSELTENPDITSEQPPLGDSEQLPLGDNEAEMEINPPKSGKFFGKASKSLIEKILKLKIILIVLAATIVFLFLAVFIGVNVSTEVTDYKLMEYIEGVCDDVTVNYWPYGTSKEEMVTEEMPLEKYISAATYTYTKDFPIKEEGTFHIYKSLAIALRTEIISNGCSITYRNDDMIKLKTNSDDIILKDALDAAKGLVVSQKGSEMLKTVHVDNFCYESNDLTNYTIFQVPDLLIPSDFVDSSVPEPYRSCPCNQPDDELEECWAEDEELGIRDWIHQDEEEGYNVYAAYYLHERFGFDTESLLQYFLGYNDIWTRDRTPDDDEEGETEPFCGEMDLHATTLSRAAFINGLQDFDYNGANPVAMDLFKKNAGLIYDVAVENNINPEFVVIRAILEGFSPGKSTNNYWGWRCYNEQPDACADFGSNFAQAVATYCEEVNNSYTDYEDLLKSYAYLGDYWYNPGSSSLGGCYYKDYIFPDGIPSRVQDACASGKSCGPGGVGSCVKTTDEEQVLYGRYQDSNTSYYREAIWGLSEGDCTTENMGAGCMWWPIGSKNTTLKDGVLYATGNPETTTITSNFGKRDAPNAYASTQHNAIDIGGGRKGKTPIIAVADGTVKSAYNGCKENDTFCGGQLGNNVYIIHDDSSMTRYGHMSEVIVNTGDSVKQGQVIGYLGNTGNSTGPHLDFQVTVDGQIVDPLNYVSSLSPRKKCNGDGSVVNGDNNKQTICKTLKNSGYSNEAIAGILANLSAESSFDSTAVNYQGCSGIAQWCFGRNTKLRSTYGDNWNNVGNQLKFMLNELQHDYASVNRYLKAKHEAEDMVYNFCMNYESPGKSYCDARISSADSMYSYAKNGCK